MHGRLASETFANGFNCAQSIVSVFSPELGIDRETALKMCTGLGSGGNYNGKICGAVVGAFIVFGLKYGTSKGFDREPRETLKTKLDAFSEQVRRKYGSIECNELLHADVSDPAEVQRLRENDVFRTFCYKLVGDIGDLMDEFL